MTHTINHHATGATAARIGEPVQLLELAANRMSAKVRQADEKRVWLPTSWITELESA